MTFTNRKLTPLFLTVTSLFFLSLTRWAPVEAREQTSVKAPPTLNSTAKERERAAPERQPGEGSPPINYEVVNSFEELRSAAQANPTGAFLLGSSLNMAGQDFDPIDDFEGTLDGGGHTISNIVASSGLFESLEPTAVIKNLKIHNVNITAGNSGIVGVLANKVKANSESAPTIDNLEITHVRVEAGGVSRVGALFGSGTCSNSQEINIRETYLQGSLLKGNSVGSIAGYSIGCPFRLFGVDVQFFEIVGPFFSSDAGGLVGNIRGDISADELTVRARVSSSGSSGSAGGFVGAVIFEGKLSFKNASFSGEVFSDGNINSYKTGGLFGRLWLAEELRLESVKVDAHVKSSSRYAGGIIGQARINQIHFSKVEFLGAVEAEEMVGGFIGDFRFHGAEETRSLNVEYSSAKGSVRGADYVGGLFGELMGSNLNFHQISFDGTVVGSKHVGGLFGSMGSNSSSISITQAFSRGYLHAFGTHAIGGMIGRGVGSVEINDAYSAMSIYHQAISAVGGLIGQCPNDLSVNQAYWDVSIAGVNTSCAGQPATTEQLISGNLLDPSKWIVGYPEFRRESEGQ